MGKMIESDTGKKNAQGLMITIETVEKVQILPFIEIRI